MNKKIYYKKVHFIFTLIAAFFMLWNAFFFFFLIYHPIFSIISLVFSIGIIIVAYRIIKVPYIEFKDDEINIKYVEIFWLKRKIKINDIRSFDTDFNFFLKYIIFTLNNDKSIHILLSRISKSDREYIINYLQEEYHLKKIPRV